MVTPRNTAKFWSHVQRGAGCWEWQAARTPRGYGQGWIGKRGLAHRLAWELTHGPIPPGLGVLHRCDNPPCVNPEHLFLGTQRDNSADALRKRRLPVGERHHSAKLTAETVRHLRATYTGQPPSELAAAYGISTTEVHAILRGRKWRALTGGTDIFRFQPSKRLAPDVVRRLRAYYAAGARNRDLARLSGINESALHGVLHRQSYRDVV